MAKIIVKKPTREELQELDIVNWNSWSCNPSTFDWVYPEEETAYILEGRCTISSDDGEIEIQSGDLVTFPQGLSCQWTVHETIRKVYR